MPTRAEIGAAGEAFVAGRLARAGYTVLDRNWRTRGGELDIVALDGDVVVFVEVRVRAARGPIHPAETVDARKLTRLLLAAERWFEAHPEHQDRFWRIDVVAVTLAADGRIVDYLHEQNLSLE